MAEQYTVVELGALGGVFSEAFGINDLGRIVGHSGHPFGSIGCMWEWPTYDPVSLGAGWDVPANPLELLSVASRVAVDGKSVGWTQKGDILHATLYSGSAIDLTSALGKPRSKALDINSGGAVVGTMGDGTGTGIGDWSAFVYDLKKKTVTTITGPGTAKAVNSSGQIAGVEYDPIYGGWQAFVYDKGQLTYITPGPGDIGNAHDINDAGQVVGDFNFTPFIYTPGEDLKILSKDDGTAEAINEFGHVVGHRTWKPRAWIYTPKDGMVMLDTLIPTGSGWNLDAAYDINVHGQIVGSGRHNGKRRGFLLIPPASKVRKNQRSDVAIDPMALILSGRAYQIWAEMHHPHTPGGQIRQLLRSMTADERKSVLRRATALVDYGKSLKSRRTAPLADAFPMVYDAFLSMTDSQREGVLAAAKTVLRNGKE